MTAASRNNYALHPLTQAEYSPSPLGGQQNGRRPPLQAGSESRPSGRIKSVALGSCPEIQLDWRPEERTGRGYAGVSPIGAESSAAWLIRQRLWTRAVQCLNDPNHFLYSIQVQVGRVSCLSPLPGLTDFLGLMR